MKCRSRQIGVVAAALMLLNCPPAAAQTGNTSVDKALDQVRRIGQRQAPSQGRKPPADAAGAQAPRAASSAASVRDAQGADPLAPPERLVGVQGVQLGSQISGATKALTARGWRAQSDSRDNGTGRGTVLFMKGNTHSLSVQADPRNLVCAVVFTQAVIDKTAGQFDVQKVSQDLIEKYGPPIYKVANVNNVSLAWIEDPAAAPAAGVDNVTTRYQRYATYKGPKLLATVARDNLSLAFGWPALEYQHDEEAKARQRAKVENAPKLKPTID